MFLLILYVALELKGDFGFCSTRNTFQRKYFLMADLKDPEQLMSVKSHIKNIFSSLFQANFGPLADSSSDYSQRTGFDLPSLQQEFRTTPEGARRETDDPLPDRIKVQLIIYSVLHLRNI